MGVACGVDVEDVGAGVVFEAGEFALRHVTPLGITPGPAGGIELLLGGICEVSALGGSESKGCTLLGGLGEFGIFSAIGIEVAVVLDGGPCCGLGFGERGWIAG